MGGSNLRQLTLSLSSEFSTYNIGQNGNFTSRVALVTYNSNASVIANLTAYNSEKELQSSLLGLKSNASDTVSNLYSAMNLALNLLNLVKPLQGPGRPSVVVIFAASSNGPSLNDVPTIAQDITKVPATIVTVNYNQADNTLNQLFGSITQPYLNLINNAQLYKNIEWALLQTNCFCPDWQPYQLTYFDTQNNRPVKYAECLQGWMLGGGDPDTTAPELCSDPEQELVAITSQQKADFIRSNCFCPDWQPYQLTYFDTQNNRPVKYAECLQGWMLGGGDPDTTAPELCSDPEQELVAITSQQKADFIRLNMSLQHYEVPYFYIGLHRNSSNGAWSWYDFIRGEAPEGGYTDWLPGYNETSTGNCVIANMTEATNLQSPYKWWTTTCNVFETGLEMQWAVCSSRACDAEFLCHYGQETESKKRSNQMKSMHEAKH
uniref:C-type lectin domain-containing protein n=1 Tax=Acrobeloides nanus TaxID=290746 RepID=A0A914C269_9BILA